ncbi:hypothetical protein Taro_037655, partial [Colocasia esculenta]|nr:hypothetical protein [Colocasia esculenta]
MELDEEADDPDDPPRPNTFLVSAIERMQAGGDARVAEDTLVTQTHHSDSEVDLDDDIQPRAPPQSQSAAPPSSRPRGPPPRPPSLSKSSSTHRHDSSQTQRMYEDLYQNYMSYPDYLRFLESTYNVRLFGDRSYTPYYEGFVDIHAQHDEEE